MTELSRLSDCSWLPMLNAPVGKNIMGGGCPKRVDALI